MSAEIIELDSVRPHYTILCTCGAHVVPEAWFQRLVEGDESVEPLPDCLMRTIVQSWMRMMGKE